MDVAEGGFVMGELWAALDEQEENRQIEAVVEELVEGLGAYDMMVQEKSECHDSAEPRFDSNNDSEGTKDDEGE